MEIITAQNIVKQHSTGHGIREVSLSVMKGQCFGVLGANGSGKTTLTRLIAGLNHIQQGQLRILGQSVFPLPPDVRRCCGIALDTPAHWDHLSGRQNLFFFARQYGLAGLALKQRVDDLLIKADLAAQADDPVSTYSFGMRRKLNIIEAISHTPDLLILDEPSAGLDMAFLDRLAEWIHGRCDEGLTTWVADNDADWLARVATNVVLLSEGHIAAGGTVNELMSSIEACYRITLELENAATFETPSLNGIKLFHHNNKHIHADINGDPQLPARLLAWITDAGGQVRSMEVHSITLHEALQQRVKRTEVAV